MWTGRHVVVGVSGGIACYKSCYLVRRLTEAGARVDVILTPSATEFVRPVTFEALSGRPVFSSLWERDRALAHIRLGADTDLIIVAPATAHLLARVAHGLADELLTTTLLAATCPVLLAPAMNDVMYAAAPTQANLALLRERGIVLVGPESGPLAESPADRPGRMSEPETILRHAARLLHRSGRLAGKRIVVTAAATREGLDPIRVVTNRSSGKMGFRLAEAAWERGAEVSLISGPSAEPTPVGVEVQRIESTEHLAAAVAAALPSADVLIMAAAPADFRPVSVSGTKRPRQGGTLSVQLEPTPDVLASTRHLRKPGSVMVGFALETGGAEAKGMEKLTRKALDLIVVNVAQEPGAGFEVDTNHVVVLSREGGRWEIPMAAKSVVARAILDIVEVRLG